MIHKCFKCGTEFEGNFCPECGEKYQEEKICPKCGAKQEGSARFCGSCGYSFVSPASSTGNKDTKNNVPENKSKIYSILLNLPSILFVLFSIALMLIFLTPVAESPSVSIMGETIPSESFGNVYQISNYEDTSLTGSLTFLIALGAISVFLAFLVLICGLFYKLRYKKVTINSKSIYVRNILTGIGNVVFFITFIISCVILTQISSLDEGMGIITAGLAPILTLVFTLLSCIISIGCVAGCHVLNKRYPSLIEVQNNRAKTAKPTGFESWIRRHKILTAAFSGLLVIGVVTSIVVPYMISNQHNGIYYAYDGETEEYNKEKFYKLNGDSWEDEEGNEGKIVFNGKDVTLTYELFGEGMEVEGTLISDVLNVNETIYAKIGHHHQYDKWEVIDEGSCSEKATETSDCACGKHEMRQTRQLINHVFAENKKATCADWGVDGKYCTICGTLDSAATFLPALHVKYKFDSQNEYMYVESVAGECEHEEIIIPSQYHNGTKVYPVKRIGNGAFSYCDSLTSIIISDSVTSIGNSAFYNCTSLANINIPNTVTSIGDSAFYSCVSLSNISIPNTVTSIGKDAFRECTSLANINLPSNITAIGEGWFNGCTSLISFNISKNIASIGDDAFVNCTSLTNIFIPSSVTSIGYAAFYGCTALTICCEANEKPNDWDNFWKDYSVPAYWGVNKNNYIEQKGITYVIVDEAAVVARYISGIESDVEIPQSITIAGKQYDVTSIGVFAFSGCTSLVNIVIPNSVTNIGESAFQKCSSLTSIVIPDSVSSIGASAFSYCSSMTSIVIPNSVISIGKDAFDECDMLTVYCEVDSRPNGWDNSWKDYSVSAYWGVNQKDIIMQGGLQYLVSDGEVVVTGITNELGVNIEIPSEMTVGGSQYEITGIGIYAFYHISFLKSVTIPNSVTNIGESAFQGCHSLTSIVLPDSVSSIGASAFSYCSSMTSIVIPNSVTSIGKFAFNGCDSLTIYCETSSKPYGWDVYWNLEGRPVYWKGQWSYVDGVPTPNN